MTLREKIHDRVDELEDSLKFISGDIHDEVRQRLDTEVYPELDDTATADAYHSQLQRYVSKQHENREERDEPLCTCSLKTRRRCPWKHGYVDPKLQKIEGSYVGDKSIEEAADRYKRGHPGTVNVLEEFEEQSGVSVGDLKLTIRELESMIEEPMKNQAGGAD